MVSTHTQQYITDFVPNTADGRSPLAMLAKTCETIGLPDVPTMKKSPLINSDGKSSMGSSPDLSMKSKSESPNDKKRERCSPRATPSTSKSEPLTSTTLPAFTAVGKSPFGALGFPTAFPFYSGASMMNPFAMHPAFNGFGMAPGHPAFMNARVPCPAAIMRQPCITPGCSTCSTPGSSNDMFANPLFSAYAAMMPTVSGASAQSGISSYQALLASAAAAANANAVAAASCGSSSTTPTPGSVSSTCSSSSNVKHTCSWMDSSTGMCGKQFGTTDELTHHMKNHAIASVNISQSSAPSPVPSTSSSMSMGTPDKLSQGKVCSSAGNTPSMRFNPYGKPVNQAMMGGAGAGAAIAAAAAAAGMQSMPAMAFNPMALHAMYAQRMMTMPHP